ncbi:MAG TPA: hypothetical protein VKH42_07225 [Vicinamibacterales bacterium]|nr:hypothetical protein [Vicinamibacterales bacterium]
MFRPVEGVDRVQQRINSGANWFNWIAGLTLINSLAAHSGSNFRFIIGLGTTQLVDAIGSTNLAPIALAIDVLVIVTCAMVAHYARESKGIYVGGMIVYGLDGLFLVLVGDLVGIGFHAFVLFNLFKGVRAFGELTKREHAAAPATTAIVNA